MQPLSDRIRPVGIDDVFGQKHILGPGKPLRRLIENNNIMNMIFFGPPGTGKTTVANIIAKNAGKKLYKLNATNASVKDIQSIIKELDTVLGYKGVVLYLDEIQNFNKKQQQSLLEFIEDGRITLIASTTENPYFSIYNAILSRSTIFQFLPLTAGDIIEGLKRAVGLLKNEGYDIECSPEAYSYIADISGGDMRKSMGMLEMAVYTENDTCISITPESIENLGQSSMRFDTTGQEHYNLLSALQKSIRGSDPDAAVHYLARLVKGGSLDSIIRRLGVIAAEDIGLAYPNALAVTNGGLQMARVVGFPEASIILSEVVVYLATLPKSDSACTAIQDALNDLDTIDTGDIPKHLQDSHYAASEKLGVKGYKYPHSYPNHYVKQQYLPDNIKDKVYYHEGENKYEMSLKEYWEKVNTSSVTS
jgi:putative ATPase